MNLNQPKGTKHTPTTRRTPSGKVIPTEQSPAPAWENLLGHLPRRHRARPVEETDGPKQSFVVLHEHTHAPRNAPRRRSRRAALRAGR